MSTEKLIPGQAEYKKGKELPFHYETTIALSFFEEAAAQGYPPVYVEFARLYEGNSRLFRGKPGVPRDDAKREYWMKKVADNFDWFQEEAKKGTEEAFKNLAYCYEHGLGVEQSFQKAFNYNAEAVKIALDDAKSEPRIRRMSDLEIAREELESRFPLLFPSQPENNQSDPQYFSSVLSNNVGSNPAETTVSDSEGTYTPAAFSFIFS